MRTSTLRNLVCLAVLITITSVVSAQTPLTTVKASQGGIITYGHVDGAATQAQAMALILKNLHKNCGERPKVGKLFKLKNSDSVAVFFTVVNHAGGNVKVAGLLIAANAGTNNVEAAVVSDDATRFRSTANPMLQQLFNTWHPAGIASTQQAPTGTGKATTPVSNGPAPKLHTVSASDNSATVGIPDGWSLDPSSTHGMMMIHGPSGEAVALCMSRTAIDSNNPRARQNLARGIRVPRTIYFPYTTDVSQNFVKIFQEWRRSNGLPPAQFKIDSVENANLGQGLHCAHARGQMNPDGKGMQSMNTLMCLTELQEGYYTVRMNHSMVPLNKADDDRSAISAMANSIKENLQVIQNEYDADSRASIAHSKADVDRNHQIGEQTTARINAAHAASDQQHAAYWADQDNKARRSATFGNYLLDQTVVQDNNMYNNGTVGHGTLWNADADALVKADPNRFEYVNQPNYWKGVDY